MRRSLVFIVLFSLVLGCSGPTFTNVGGGRAKSVGIGVTPQSIEQYARDHGVSTVEAKARIRAEAAARRIESHANKYGLTIDQAKEQLKYAGEIENED